MEEKVFKTYIKGIYCVQCPEIILSGLLQKRGVIDADVAYFKSLVSVRYDPAIIDESEIKSELEDMGYPPFFRRPTLSEQLVARIQHLFAKENGQGDFR